jgi:protein tyrosine/serine phosphatase
LTDEPHLDWPGCFNVRDLGGLPAAGGRRTRRGAIVRADSLGRLTEQGWQALVAHGVRTVVDLRNDEERIEDAAPRPSEIVTVHVPLDGTNDRSFWKPIEETAEFGTPLYYRAHLMRKPELSVAAIAAIARAQPGGVVFHCVGGRDRSGQIAMLLLSLAGVAAEAIVADYELSQERLAGLFAAMGREDEGAEIAAFLAERGTSTAEVIATTLSSMDLEATLRAGGMTDEDLAALRERMLEPAPAGGSTFTS